MRASPWLRLLAARLNRVRQRRPRPAFRPQLEGLETRCLLSATVNEFPVGSGSVPYVIHAGPDGNVWFSEAGIGHGGILGRITPSGQVSEIGFPISYINSFVFASDGTIWIGSSQDVYQCNLQGVLLQDFPIPSTAGTLGRRITVCQGPDGNIWYTDGPANSSSGSSVVGRITPDGQITEFPVPPDDVSGGLEEWEIVPGPDGNVWFDFIQQHLLGRVTPTGDVTIFHVDNLSERYGGAYRGLTTGPDGNLWMSFDRNNAITVVNPSGQLVATYGDPDAPWALTPGPDGNIWFTEYGPPYSADGGNHIGRITPEGTITEYPIPTLNAVAFYITAGPDGNIWFTEGGVGQIGQVVLNQPPVANPGGPYTIPEGASLTLDASGSSDPDGDPLSYTWDVNGDGVFGDATGVSPTLTWSQLNALGITDGPSPSPFNVRVRVSDGVNAPVTSDPTTLTVANAPPTVTIIGPSAGAPGQPLSYTFTASDPSPVDQAGAFTYSIDWDGDGTVDQTVSGAAVVQLTHTYSTTGDYTVRATATDKDGGAGPAASLPVTITHALIEGSDLVVGGTPGDDHIQFTPAGSSGGVAVSLNGVALGTFYPTGRLVAYAGDGDDDIQVASGISLPAWLYGGAGNDRLKGGSGNNVLLGGAGDDLLVGGGSRDILIGGFGADRIVGNAEDDVLVSGTTAFDGNEAALASILAEWTSARDYATRVANITGTGTGTRVNGDYFLRVTSQASTTTVFDDGAADVMTGTSGQDWYFANLAGGGVLDRITDLSAAEFANDLSFING